MLYKLFIYSLLLLLAYLFISSHNPVFRVEGQIMNTEKKKEFEKVAAPLIEFIKNNCHPHVTVIVDSRHAEVLEGICVIKAKDREEQRKGGV